jgi:uncharacterized protein YidB (DUF937 family)
MDPHDLAERPRTKHRKRRKEMGVFDDLAGKVLGGIGGGGAEHSGLMQEVLGVLSSQGTGGLGGLVKTFQEKGLGDIVSSWVGTGANQPISPQQVQEGLGHGLIEQIATKVGISPEVASSNLAEILPRVVDYLTPQGKIPEGGTLEKGLALLKSRFSQG